MTLITKNKIHIALRLILRSTIISTLIFVAQLSAVPALLYVLYLIVGIAGVYVNIDEILALKSRIKLSKAIRETLNGNK